MATKSVKKKIPKVSVMRIALYHVIIEDSQGRKVTWSMVRDLYPYLSKKSFYRIIALVPELKRLREEWLNPQVTENTNVSKMPYEM